MCWWCRVALHYSLHSRLPFIEHQTWKVICAPPLTQYCIPIWGSHVLHIQKWYRFHPAIMWIHQQIRLKLFMYLGQHRFHYRHNPFFLYLMSIRPKWVNLFPFDRSPCTHSLGWYSRRWLLHQGIQWIGISNSGMWMRYCPLIKLKLSFFSFHFLLNIPSSLKQLNWLRVLSVCFFVYYAWFEWWCGVAVDEFVSIGWMDRKIRSGTV